MRFTWIACSLLLLSCGKQEAQEGAQSAGQGEVQIEKLVSSLYQGFARAYNEGGINTDSLIDAYYDKDIRYVTSWGWAEPIDTTKARLRNALAHVRDYNARIEGFQAKVYGDGAYAFFILRQSTYIDGALLEEYLPTTLALERRGSGWKIVHAHRSTDYETFEQYIAMQKKNGNK